MATIAKTGGAPEQGENLEQIRQRFSRWRGKRRRGERIPEALWAAAVRMAREHGLEEAVRALRVDTLSLQRRLEPVGDVAASGNPLTMPRFVELISTPAPPPGMCECVIEMANRHGATMRVELNGPGVAGLAGLCSAFWGAP